MRKKYWDYLNQMILLFFILLISACSSNEVPIDDNANPKDEENLSDGSDNTTDDSNSDVSSPANYYRFTTYQTSTADPFDINVLFHVSDSLCSGVEGLTVQDLRITENDEESPVDESKATLFDRNSFSLSLKTALVIDVSNSIQADFDDLKIQLKKLIDVALPYQEIAIYTFSSSATLELDYTTDKSQLKSTIDDLQLGTSSTDFYGAVVTAANSVTNGFMDLEVTIGNLIIFTDGEDTQASSTFSEAEESIVYKNVYVVGLESHDLDENKIRNLVGNSFYYSSENLVNVDANFLLVQTEIEHFANSIYLLNYETPKRGDNNHFLKIFHKRNGNVGDDKFSAGEFTSTGFYEPVSPTVAGLLSPTQNEDITLTNTCSVSFDVGKSIDENLSANDEITYEFYFGISEANLELIDSKTVSVSQDIIKFESPAGLVPQTNYFWRIKTKDDDFEELDTLSETQRFLFLESIFDGNISLSNQAQMDSFCYNVIKGNLLISDLNLKITDYLNLELVRVVEGDVSIRNETKGNIDYLNNLETIGGSLRFNDFDGPESITGFKGLREIGGSISLSHTGSGATLKEINGFNALMGKVFNMSINSLENLESIIGFNSLEILDGFTLLNNSKLIYINGFNALRQVDNFRISENSSIQRISGYKTIESINNFILDRNPQLDTLEGFQNIHSIVSLDILNCGFASIKLNATSINNIKLVDCEVLKSFDFRHIAFQVNNIDLSNLPNLTSLNGVSGQDVSVLNLRLNTLTNLNDLTGLEGLGGFETLVITNNDKLTSLNGLRDTGQFTRLKAIRIEANDMLVNYCNLAVIEPTTVQTFNISQNAYNPSLEELTNGNCEQKY